MSNVLFILNVHSAIDVITNSSSELFVGKAQSKKLMIELIKSVYPNYLDEYAEIKSTSELSIEEFDQFFSYHCSAHMWPARKKDYPILPGFTFEELYEPERDWNTGEVKKAWNGEIQYELRNNSGEKYGDFVTKNNLKSLKKRVDPKNEMYFLYSLDENPNWEYQEQLMNIMNRYHLG